MRTINKDILSDNFRLEGMKLPNLREDLQKMNEVTKIIEIDSFELTLYSIIDRRKDMFTVVRLHPDKISNEMIFSTVQNRENFVARGQKFVITAHTRK